MISERSCNYVYRTLRASMGITYLYSGPDMLMNPSHWYGYMPQWFSRFLIDNGSSVNQWLFVQGIIETAFGVILLFWFLDRWALGRRAFEIAAALITLQLVLILLYSGVDPNTFRDFALIGASVSILILAHALHKNPLSKASI